MRHTLPTPGLITCRPSEKKLVRLICLLGVFLFAPHKTHTHTHTYRAICLLGVFLFASHNTHTHTHQKIGGQLL